MKPLKPEINRIIFLWPIFNFKHKIKQCHIQYLMYLFNQDTEGSIIHTLRKHGWCLQLLADLNEDIYEIPQFRIQVLLTDEGMKFMIKIQGYILAYINLIKEKGLERSSYELFLTQNTLIFESAFKL